MDLLARWQRLWSGMPASAEMILATYKRWDAAYSEPQRAYHTKRHVEDCLQIFEKTSHLAKEPQRVEAAIWWHDVVYDTSGDADNEKASAEFARSEMKRLGCDEYFTAWVAEAILATKHNRVALDTDIQLLLDIDLHSLGVGARTYKQHSAALRKESESVRLDVYRRKRIRILEAFLKRIPLFYLPYFTRHFDRQARQNMRQEIRCLRKALK